jgi:hypothetical protein
MLRLVGGTVAGAVVWFVGAFILGQVLVHAWPQFAAITATKNPTLYTVPMLAARLGVSAVASIIGGAVAAWLGKDGFRAPLATGVVLLVVFVPYHTLMIWNQFPLWYHLTFFVSLPVLSVVGGRLVRG